MRKSIVTGLIVLYVLNMTMPAYSDDNPITKFSRGLCNIVTFHFEILERSRKVRDTSGSIAGMTYGLGKGIVMAGVRALVGIYEIITFPIPYPEDYRPILKDPISFFPEPKKKESK